MFQQNQEWKADAEPFQNSEGPCDTGNRSTRRRSRKLPDDLYAGRCDPGVGGHSVQLVPDRVLYLRAVSACYGNQKAHPKGRRMITAVKIVTPFVCAGAGILGASASVMTVTIIAVVAMFFTDIFGVVKPVIQGMARRRQFIHRQMNRINWPKQEPDLPPIEYKVVKWY